MKKLFSIFAFIIAILWCIPAQAYRRGSAFNEGILYMDQYPIAGDPVTGLYFDPDSDGNNEAVFNSDGTLTLGEVTYPATDGSNEQALLTDGNGLLYFGDSFGAGDIPDSWVRNYESDTMDGTLTINDGLHVNEDGGDQDSHIEGNTDALLTVWDAGLNSIGISNAAVSGRKVYLNSDQAIGLYVDMTKQASTNTISMYISNTNDVDNAANNVIAAEYQALPADAGTGTTFGSAYGIKSTAGAGLGGTGTDAYAGYFISTDVGTLTNGYALYASASGANTNYGLYVDAGNSVIDVTSTEAFLVRKNADGGDVFTVDTISDLVTVTGDLKSTDDLDVGDTAYIATGLKIGTGVIDSNAQLLSVKKTYSTSSSQRIASEVFQTNSFASSSGTKYGYTQWFDQSQSGNISGGTWNGIGANYQVTYSGILSGTGIINLYGIKGLAQDNKSNHTAGTEYVYGGHFRGNTAGKNGREITVYGIYSDADAGDTNWAGYFDDGNVYIKNVLFIGDDLDVTDTASIDGTLKLSTGSITDTSGAISFGNENLLTTGTLTVGTEGASPSIKFAPWAADPNYEVISFTSGYGDNLGGILGGLYLISYPAANGGFTLYDSTLTKFTTMYTNPTTGKCSMENSGGEFNFYDDNIKTTGTLGAGAITGTSFIIGANTLTTSEWAFLDGQDQAVKTTSNVIFNQINLLDNDHIYLGTGKDAEISFTGSALLVQADLITATDYLQLRGGTNGIKLDIGATAVGLVTATDIRPAADNTFYLGKNDDDTPAAWKGVILKDTTDGKYYRVEVISGVVTATDLTD